MKTALAASLFAATLLIACGDGDRNYTVEEVRSDRAPLIPTGAGASDMQRLGLTRMGGGSPHGANPHGGMNMPSRGPTFDVALPKGWKKLPAKQFRDVNLTLERDSSVECFLTIMPGGGGGLAGNINRWRGQMNQPQIAAAEIAKLPKIEMFKREATLVELTGSYVGMGGAAKQNWGFLAAYLEMPGTALTLKMTGPQAVIAEERDNFVKVASSLKLASGHGAPHGQMPTKKPSGDDAIASGMATGASGFAWDTPKGWTKGRDRSMRIVTLHPGGNQDAQCYIAMMGGTGGGLDMNINRWLDQVGNPALKPMEISQLPKVDMLGKKGVLIESYGTYTGMGDENKKQQGLLGIVCLLEGRAVFVKFIGPADLVKREKDNFIAFSRSLRPAE
ncbi:MAG: hypothetical protein ACYTHK_09965 [Planctomycetota bacterium]|jgi:hypothetical protein